jgi:hypothetical protein
MKDQAGAGLISEFWAWFDAYRSGIDGGTIPQVEEQHLEEIVERLGGIESGLAVELSVREDGVKELTISADGVRDNFAVVEQIVSQAPWMEGWAIIAFRQPIKADFSLQCGDLELNPSELYFHPIEEDGALDIIVYGQRFGEQDENELSYYGLIMIDNLIGEYDCVTQVRHYDFQELPDEQETEGLVPLSELPSFIEARK